jgi:hypothetical protein
MGDKLAKGEITPFELEQEVQRECGLPSLRDNGLKLMADGKTDLDAMKKVLDLTYET